ncbi:RpsU Ribosomal protein S21 [uncultured Caudovirales phage]|uniref:RpsU Ribosomal protein S21 n=1 Tax=uncultured Caudovirales phage TaxID=2100421 RepID=A0A6J5MCP3_9CAUD|nr:RpsU Ribosomal protein S21 [uncultured Caudovirales phage]
MLIVTVRSGNIEFALKEYKRKVQLSKQIESLRERQEYQKPSVKRRTKLENAKRNSKK